MFILTKLYLFELFKNLIDLKKKVNKFMHKCRLHTHT